MDVPSAQNAAASAMNQLSPYGQTPVLGMIYQEMERQAAVMAFLDDFRLIAYIFFILTPLSFLMRKPAAFTAASAGH